MGTLLPSRITFGVRVPHDRWTCPTHFYSHCRSSLAVPSGMTYVFIPTKSYPPSAVMTGKSCHFPCLPECLISVSLCVRIDGLENECKDQTVSIVLCQPVLKLQHCPEIGMCPWWIPPHKKSQTGIYRALHIPPLFTPNFSIEKKKQRWIVLKTALNSASIKLKMPMDDVTTKMLDCQVRFVSLVLRHLTFHTGNCT